MSLSTCLSSMTVADMKALAGKTRSKGAKTKDEAQLAALLALGVRGAAAIEQLPVAVQQKIERSAPAKRELERIQMASLESVDWRDFGAVLDRFPPSVLLTILNEEMTCDQMKALAGKARAEGATLKADLIFGVLLALAERGRSAMRDLPVNARRRIDAAPS